MNQKDIEKQRIEKGRFLANKRISANITKKALSLKTGLSRNTIDRIENGSTSWTVDTEMLYLNGLK
jgi:transcriptional regulator with XRE-family HTH domain